MDYVQYFFAHVAGQAMRVETQPPHNVLDLWRLHLVVTENYQRLEQRVFEAIKEIDRGINNIKHIHHSSTKVNKDEGHINRVEAT